MSRPDVQLGWEGLGDLLGGIFMRGNKSNLLRQGALVLSLLWNIFSASFCDKKLSDHKRKHLTGVVD